MSTLDEKQAEEENSEDSLNDEGIFRKVSIEKKRHPEQLDSLLVVVNPISWVALICLYLIIASTLIWAFFGSLPLMLEGRGIFMSEKGGVTVQTMVNGVVQRIHAAPGNMVAKGDLIAEIFDPKEDLKFKVAQIKVDNLTRNVEQLKNEVDEEEQAKRAGVKTEIAAKEYTIQQKELRIKSLQEDLEKKKKLLAEGLISANSLRDEESKIFQENIDIENAKAAIENLKASLLKGRRAEEIKSKLQELLKATEERDLLYTSLESSKVYSPVDGRVLELFVNKGDHVNLGDPLVWIEIPPSDENPLVVYSYFPINTNHTIKDLKPGQSVEVIISKDTKILGTIRKVSQYPVSSETILRLFHSKALEQYLTSGTNAVVQATVELKRDRSGHLVLQFFGEYPADSEIATGTVCRVQAITSRVRPIYYLLPMEHFKQRSLTED